MRNDFPIARAMTSIVAFSVGLFLISYWLFTGQFWRDTRAIDWVVYILMGDRLFPLRKQVK